MKSSVNLESRIYEVEVARGPIKETLRRGFVFRVLDDADNTLGCLSITFSTTALDVWHRNSEKFLKDDDALLNFCLFILPYIPIYFEVRDLKDVYSEGCKCVVVMIQTEKTDLNLDQKDHIYLQSKSSPEAFAKELIYRGEPDDSCIQTEILKVLRRHWKESPDTNLLIEDLESRVFILGSQLFRNLKYLEEKNYIKANKSTGDWVSTGITASGLDYLSENDKMDYMNFRHKISVVREGKKVQFYRGTFQPDICFLPIEADVEEGDELRLEGEGGEILDKMRVVKVDKYHNGRLAHIEAHREDKRDGVVSSQIRIENSRIFAPITAGNGNVVMNATHDIDTDLRKVTELIDTRPGLGSSEKQKLKSLVETELPDLLSEPELKKSEQLISKIRNLGELWLVPIITQIVAAYFQHRVGINT